MSKTELKKLEDQLNNFLVSKFPELLPRTPNMRYFQVKKDYYAFCWTTQPTTKEHKFYACVYRILKNGTWKLKKRVGFARRKIAKARAWKWFEQRKKILADKESEVKK